ncbi:MAG: hypothetical protein KHY44_13685 [Clostridiales bacterium]|nr:hypothetical protein [Clostridiales bacterium]
MLTPELKKLKQQLEGHTVQIDKQQLLAELNVLENDKLYSINESLAGPSNKCKACGKPL